MTSPGSYEAVRNSQPRRRDLARQLLDAIEAWEDALTDDERQAQQEQAQALLDRLVGGRDDMTDSVPQAQARWRVLWMPAHRDPLLPPNVYSECQHKDCVLADLAYLRAEKGDSEAWIEQRLATPWERTDD